MARFEELLGKTLVSVVVAAEKDTVDFVEEGGQRWRLYHSQDCCESVEVEEVIGDLADLVGSPILLAEEVESEKGDPPLYAESWTWTFYKLSTIKGSVTLRWLGQSNGYYSESVSFRRVGN
jgi:hypothetical protein